MGGDEFCTAFARSSKHVGIRRRMTVSISTSTSSYGPPRILGRRGNMGGGLGFSIGGAVIPRTRPAKAARRSRSARSQAGFIGGNSTGMPVHVENLAATWMWSQLASLWRHANQGIKAVSMPNAANAISIASHHCSLSRTAVCGADNVICAWGRAMCAWFALKIFRQIVRGSPATGPASTSASGE